MELMNLQVKEYELPFYWAGSVLIGESQTYQDTSVHDIPMVYKVVGAVSMLFFIVAFFMLFRSLKRRSI